MLHARVAQLVEAVRSKRKGWGFESLRGYHDFSVDLGEIAC
jgi:hypothetical protein